MTTFRFYYPRCFYCKSRGEGAMILSTHTFGLPDLDFRPQKGARITIPFWVQRCPSCGYCAPKISAWYTERDAEIIKSEEYRAQLNNPDYPELANSFICFSIIMEKSGNYRSAGIYTHYAAWACDDEMNMNGARNCRIRAVHFFDKVPDRSFKIKLIEVDLLRRAGLFEEAMKRCEALLDGPVDLTALEEGGEFIGVNEKTEEKIKRKMEKYRMYMDILKFQKQLIQKGDDSCHTIGEAMRAKESGFNIYL